MGKALTINRLHMKEFNDNNFKQEVIDTGRLAVVDFWAPWCAPCRALAPIFEAVAADYDGRVTMGKFNVDAGISIPAEYGIRSIPTILFFKNGELIDKQLGAVSREALIEKIENLMK